MKMHLVSSEQVHQRTLRLTTQEIIAVLLVLDLTLEKLNWRMGMVSGVEQ